MANLKFSRQKEIILLICCAFFSIYQIYQSSIFIDHELKILSTHGANNKITSHVCEYPPWQKAGYTTSNIIHEIDLISSLITKERTQIVGLGGTRMAWNLPSFDKEIIYKTISWKRKVDHDTIPDNHNDAIATEKLAFSSHVIKMYGYCGTSILIEKGYDSADNYFIKNHVSSINLLYFAKNAARSIEHVHSIKHEKSNITSLIHADVRPWNFLIMDNDGSKDIKLYDFNYAKFRGFYNDTGEICQKQHVTCNRNNSPEECLGKKIDEKIDVYCLGNFIYFLLTKKGLYSFPLTNKMLRNQLVKHRFKPVLPDSVRYSHDPSIIAMRNVMNKCTLFYADDRPSAKDVADELEYAYNRIFNEFTKR